MSDAQSDGMNGGEGGYFNDLKYKNNHIGQKNWNRLTPGQKRNIIANRKKRKKNFRKN